jgi:hypothetical protein
VPDVDDPAVITQEERRFAAALSAATLGLISADVSDLLIPAALAGSGQSMVAGLSLNDGDSVPDPRLLIDFGVHFCGDTVTGDRLDSQLFSLREPPTGWGISTSGPVEELARRTADWFATVLRRPVVLYVWLHAGHAYAAQYAFADTAETLSQCYSRQRAPDGQPEAMVAAGHVHGRGWIQTAGLPAPDLYLHVRGDLGLAQVPDELRLVTRRGPLPGLWYE